MCAPERLASKRGFQALLTEASEPPPWFGKAAPLGLHQILFGVQLWPACVESRVWEADTSLTLNYLDFVKGVCVAAIFQGQEDIGLRKGSEFLDHVLLGKLVGLGIWDLTEQRGIAGIRSALGLGLPCCHGPARWGPWWSSRQLFCSQPQRTFPISFPALKCLVLFSQRWRS